MKINMLNIRQLMVLVNMIMLLLSSIYFIWTLDAVALKIMGTNIVLFALLVLIGAINDKII